jgi:GT2 family glycosyltransferase
MDAPRSSAVPGSFLTMTLTMSVVIPTKNRPDDLLKAVDSILAQTRPPEELLIIDQSEGMASEHAVRSRFEATAPTRLVYVHDTAITGLVDAKRVGSKRAAGDIVCFLEDDVILERDYMAQIESGFLAEPAMCGCSGVIVNVPRSSPMYIAAQRVFFRGIFRDPRLPLTARALNGGRQLMSCDVLSGGISSWRRDVFKHVQFDVANGFFMFEDMEFSTRVVKALGHHLYINPRARLEHHMSGVNRDRHGTRQRRKLREALLFYKKRSAWPGARGGLLLVMAWWLTEAAAQTVRLRSIGPLTGYLRGVADGIRTPLQ